MTGFGSFDNSTCKRVLDLLEPGDLKLGQVVIKRVAVVELGENNGSGDGGSCFGIEVWTDTAKLADMVIARLGEDEIWSEKVRCSSNMKPRFRAEWVVVSGELLIQASCLLRPMSRNSVLQELSVRRFAVIQEEIRSRVL